MSDEVLARLMHYCEAEREWCVETAYALVEIESPTTDKIAVDRCGRALCERLKSLGGRVTVFPRTEAGDHLLAEFGCGYGQILVLGHFDTVWPIGQLERMPVDIRNGRLYGPGAFDMKGGIAIAMLAARALSELGWPLSKRLVMLWTTDEETGSGSSRPIIEDEARRSDAVLVLEPSLPGGGLKTFRKGVGEFTLRVRGVAGHAGMQPAKAVSAIHELVHQLVALQPLQDPSKGRSLNVGVISGGTRSNVIAEHAEAKVDVRVSTMSDAADVSDQLKRLRPVLHGASIEVTGGINRPPLERSAAVAHLYGMAKAVAASLGVDLQEGGTGGGSDGNFTAALGVPTLDGLGAVGDGAHALHEHLEIGHLAWRAALIAGLILKLDETEVL